MRATVRNAMTGAMAAANVRRVNCAPRVIRNIAGATARKSAAAARKHNDDRGFPPGARSAFVQWSASAPGAARPKQMTYSVKEIYYTLQGEGAQTGRPAVFLRFAGCNLWSGLEKDRGEAVCRFCDTDFVGTDGPGGGKFADAAALVRAVAVQWPKGEGRPYVV